MLPSLKPLTNNGSLIDHQRPGNPAPPYVSNIFTGYQTFHFCCPGMAVVEFPGYSGIPITRTIDHRGSHGWFYTITKQGETLTEQLPLPLSAS
jgi:hypothetical protein